MSGRADTRHMALCLRNTAAHSLLLPEPLYCLYWSSLHVCVFGPAERMRYSPQ